MIRRRWVLAATAITVATSLGVIGYHDFRPRTVARGVVDDESWSLIASRSLSQLCLDVWVEGQLTGGGCDFSDGDPTATASVAGRTAVYGPAPARATTVVVEGVRRDDLRVRTRPLSWLPRERVFIAILPPSFEYRGFHFEDSAGRSFDR